MDAAVQAYLDHIEELHREMGKSLEGLDPSALDWVPIPEQNSLAVLTAHTMGAERNWVHRVIGGLEIQRDRDAEFRTRNTTTAELQARLAETLETTRRVLEPLTAADLNRPVVVPRDGSTRTVAWGLAHTLEHGGLHLGHMQVIRQWWERRF